MNYTVDPGLYALGDPGPDSPVLVTANYKLSFDRVRKALAGRNVWVLVLDTNGINVWCAAGKGTFGTKELVDRIASSNLSKVVSHKTIILPQLAGPGVAAYQVKKLSGFKAAYGPVRAEDAPAFIDAGFTATPEMRVKSFGTWERTVLIPVELVDALKVSALIMPVFFLLGGLGGPGDFWQNAQTYGLFAVGALMAAVLAGAAVTPILLPWLPGRAFSMKGFIIGLALGMLIVWLRLDAWATWSGRLEIIGWLFLVPAVTAHLAMNFTGASTYTSLSGVRKEMNVAVPLQIAGAVLGLALWLGSRFTA
jgi:CO dehydrogenase/acetyl-CoA synthase delta subunit